jgi:hypothetical protein
MTHDPGAGDNGAADERQTARYLHELEQLMPEKPLLQTNTWLAQLAMGAATQAATLNRLLVLYEHNKPIREFTYANFIQAFEAALRSSWVRGG